MSDFYAMIKEALAGAERVAELLEETPDVVERPSAIELTERARGAIAFQNVAFQYERGERVHQAMVARGYDGVMPTLFPPSARAADWVVGASPALIAILVAVLTRTVAS